MMIVIDDNMNIVLIGFMGTGKTTVGKMLSTKLKMKFIDIDEFIEENKNKKIKDIFIEYGEEYFRRLEHNAVKFICEKNSQLIISTGGGVVLNPENIEILRQNGKVFLLKARLHTICENLKGTDISERPLLREDDFEEKLAYLMKKRKHLYEIGADYIINIDFKTPENITDEIIQLFIE